MVIKGMAEPLAIEQAKDIIFKSNRRDLHIGKFSVIRVSLLK